MVARVTLNVRIGRRKSGPQFEARAQAFTSKLGPAGVSDFKARVGNLIGIGARDAAGNKVEQKLTLVIPKVQQEIRADLERYSRSALKFFFSRKTSTGHQDLIINLSELMTRGPGFTSNFKRMQYGKDPAKTVLTWAPLSDATIETKRRRGDAEPTTYFVGSGQLKAQMQTQLPQFFERILNPGIQVTFSSVYDKSSTLKGGMVPVANIELVVGTTNKAGLAGMAFMRGQLNTPGPMNSTLLSKYLHDAIEHQAKDIITKLENRGTPNSRIKNPRRQRPWVEAAMSFWVLNRLPAVFQASVHKHLKDKI